MSEATMTTAEFDARLETTNERIRQETQELKEQNHVLRELLERRQRFAARLKDTLAELEAEQETMDAEIRLLLSPVEIQVLIAA